MIDFRELLHIFFPVSCASCGVRGSAFCEACILKLPLAADLEDNATFAVYDYANPHVRHAVRTLKYHRRSESASALARAGARHMCEFIAEHLQSTSEVALILVPIPEYRTKLRDRGFNQSVTIARALKSELPNSKIEEVLQKTSATTPQAHLNRTQRLKNVKLSMQTTKPLNPKSLYVIIDDVTTTGATFAEARRALRAGGAKKIIAIALSHGFAHNYSQSYSHT